VITIVRGNNYNTTIPQLGVVMKKYGKKSDAKLGFEMPDLVTAGKYAATAAIAGGITYFVIKHQDNKKKNALTP
jgi:hypothetical protein